MTNQKKSKQQIKGEQRKKKQAIEERRHQAWNLHLAGVGYQAIADRLGVSLAQCYRDVQHVLKELHEIRIGEADHERTKSLARIDRMIQGLFANAIKGSASAVREVRALEHLRMKLLGLDKVSPFVRMNLSAAEKEDIENPPQLTLEVMSATWVRALQVAEHSFKSGELPAPDYLRTVTQLSGLAGRAIEIQSRQADLADVPPIEISVDLKSRYIAESESSSSLPGPCGDEIVPA